VVDEARASDGASRALGAEGAVRPDSALTRALEAAGDVRAGATVVSADLFYDSEERLAGWAAEGIAAVEMESAALLRLGELRGVATASLLAVSDVIRPGSARQRLDADGLETAGRALGAVAARALSSPARRP
jgi:purine-nucleoside phosphorylase